MPAEARIHADINKREWQKKGSYADYRITGGKDRFTDRAGRSEDGEQEQNACGKKNDGRRVADKRIVFFHFFIAPASSTYAVSIFTTHNMYSVTPHSDLGVLC